MEPKSCRFLRVLATVLVLLCALPPASAGSTTSAPVQYTTAAINPRGDDDYDRTRYDEAYANIKKMQILQSLDLCLILSSGLGTAGTVGIALGILVLAMTAWICRYISRRARAELPAGVSALPVTMTIHATNLHDEMRAGA